MASFYIVVGGASCEMLIGQKRVSDRWVEHSGYKVWSDSAEEPALGISSTALTLPVHLVQPSSTVLRAGTAQCDFPDYEFLAACGLDIACFLCTLVSSPGKYLC